MLFIKKTKYCWCLADCKLLCWEKINTAVACGWCLPSSLSIKSWHRDLLAMTAWRQHRLLYCWLLELNLLLLVCLMPWGLAPFFFPGYLASLLSPWLSAGCLASAPVCPSLPHVPLFFHPRVLFLLILSACEPHLSLSCLAIGHLAFY